jgi:DNA helicase-2/ATP-dependent DNA helicase PcrA
MNGDLTLRPAQQEVLAYRGGRMAVSAVPGSGKTFTLSLLAAQIIAEGRLDVAAGQQVLIVTYLNASVETFRARIRRRLHEMELPDLGFDVRTLHSLALEIVRSAGDGLSEDLAVLDENQSRQIRASVVDNWISDHTRLWEAFLPEERSGLSPQMRARWRETTEQMAGTFIRTAKNGRYRPEDIVRTMRERSERPIDGEEQPIGRSPLLAMMAGIYERYQSALTRLGAMDYDDLIWGAVDRLEFRPDLAVALRGRWPYVLEDEAQDSVPLQELLLENLTGSAGNWVRVGDPNQAITSTFTAAHPRYFNAFIDRPDVIARTLPNSGRSAEVIIGAANALLNWTIDHHPVDEVREHAFRRQDILPTPAGDAQPNPPDSEADMRIHVYRSREDEELPTVAADAWAAAVQRPDQTVAILVPTNQIGYAVAEHLDALDADYDNMLRGSGREREIAAVLHAVLGLLADPLNTRALQTAHAGLVELGEEGAPHPAVGSPLEDAGRFQTLLRSIHQPEAVLFPAGDAAEDAYLAALPAGVASEEDLVHLEQFVGFIRRLFDLRSLPVDDLTLALADELFGPGAPGMSGDETGGRAHELDLAIAYQIASQLRQWREAQPEWRLPELVSQLGLVASGQRTLNLVRTGEEGYEPKPGRVTLATQHSAKGLEWDTVFLVGIDGYWVPGSLDASFQGFSSFLGGDPHAEVAAQLHYLMRGEAGLFPHRNATESAHIEVICERLRLLYVGITRARRTLVISRSRVTRTQSQGRERDAEPASALGLLYRYLKARKGEIGGDG